MTVYCCISKAVLKEVYIADTFCKRFLGYMFQKKPRYKAILIKPCSSIHSFFMNFNIDVLFIDENYEVIKKVDALKPGKIIFTVQGAKMVLEGPEGTFEKINLGQKISMN